MSVFRFIEFAFVYLRAARSKELITMIAPFPTTTTTTTTTKKKTKTRVLQKKSLKITGNRNSLFSGNVFKPSNA